MTLDLAEADAMSIESKSYNTKSVAPTTKSKSADTHFACPQLCGRWHQTEPQELRSLAYNRVALHARNRYDLVVLHIVHDELRIAF